jgi:predicted transcriptional regulator
MAKGRLSKQEKYIIEGMLKDNYSASNIAKELGRTEKTILSYSKTANKSKKKKPKPSEPVVPAKAKDLMVHETALKKDKGVSIMTESASARGDINSDLSPSRMSKGAIYKIKKDE